MFAVDTEVLPVSDAIAFLTRSLDVTDISVEGVQVDDMVLGLYREYAV